MGKSDLRGNSVPLPVAAARAGAIFEAAASIPALANNSRRCNITFALPCDNVVPTISEFSRPFGGPALDNHLLIRVEFHGIATLSVQHAQEAILPAAERKVRHGCGHADIDTHIA